VLLSVTLDFLKIFVAVVLLLS
jgi:hypothetical protein